MKEKLNLTVELEFKLLAQEIAKARRRSVSQLFEDLIEQASARTAEAPNIIPVPLPEKPPITYAAKKRAK